MKYIKRILKNGTRVILAPSKGTETVTVQILVEAGSKYETIENNGISHFLEHMMFKGTEKRSNAKIIAEELDGVGGEYNAFTGKEQTGYWVKVPKKHFKMALDLVGDIYLNSKFEQKEIDKEKGVILQEMAMYKDMPMRYVWDLFENLFYGNQPAGWNIIGTTNNINHFKRKDFINYLNNFYIPQSTVITIVGNFNQKNALEKIENTFEKIEKREKIKKIATVHNQKNPRLKLENKKTDQTHLILGVKSVDMFDENRHVTTLLATILGGGMSSRMFEELREKRGLTYYVSSGSDQYTDSGYFFANAGVEHKNLEKTIKLILKEFKKVIDKKIPEKEIIKAKEYIKGTTTMSLESSSAIASFLGNQELFRKEIKSPQEIFKKIDAVTAEDLQKIAFEIFKDENLNLTVIGPHEKIEKYKKLLTFKK